MGFFDGLFGKGYQNPAESAMPYLNQIPGATSGYLQPYVNAGQSALPQLQGQYDTLLNDPGAKLNAIGGSFQQSPGFQFALQQALQGAQHQAALGGMYGSPEHEQYAMQLATNLGNQDYYNYLDKALGLYNQGLSGEQGLASGGLQAGGSMADMIAAQLAQQAQLAYTGQQNENQNNSSMWNNIGTGIGALSAFTPFAPVGKAVSGFLGGK